RFPGSAGRPADRPHRAADRALQDPQAGPPQPSRPADDGQPPSQPAGLPAPQGRGALQGADPETGPASLSETTAAAQRCAAVFFATRNFFAAPEAHSTAAPPHSRIAPRDAAPGAGLRGVDDQDFKDSQVAKISKSFQ